MDKSQEQDGKSGIIVIKQAKIYHSEYPLFDPHAGEEAGGDDGGRNLWYY
ncbi:MAG: hypothetical protein ABIJ26_04975 [Candidatus Margulisiibacteriota bacterium]